jgi:hypothetical protein
MWPDIAPTCPRIPGDTPSQRLSIALRTVLSISKTDLSKKEARLKRASAKKRAKRNPPIIVGHLRRSTRYCGRGQEKVRNGIHEKSSWPRRPCPRTLPFRESGFAQGGSGRRPNYLERIAPAQAQMSGSGPWEASEPEGGFPYAAALTGSPVRVLASSSCFFRESAMRP